MKVSSILSLGLCVLLAGLLEVVSSAAADEAGVARFDRLAWTLGPLCATGPSTQCFATAFELADTDGSDALSIAELERIRQDLGDWLDARRQALTTTEATYVTLGMRIVDVVGLDRLHASYDLDENGALDRQELQADVMLDERTLGRVVLDGDAVDWVSLQARLGALGAAMLPR